MAEHSVIPIIASTSAAFGGLFLILDRVIKTPEKMMAETDPKAIRVKRYEYITNVNSLIHAVVTWLGSCYLIMYQSTAYDAPNTFGQAAFAAFSCGYFIVDTITGMYYGYNDKLMLIHHIFAIYLQVHLLYKGMFGTSYVWTMFVGEVANPVFIIRKNLSWHSIPKIYDAVMGIVFCISFLFFRTIVATYAMTGILASEATFSFKFVLVYRWKL
jgi:hypothetical protein